MKRFVLLLLCVFMLTGAVFADSSITNMHASATLDSNRDCQVSLTVTLSLEAPAGELLFPLAEKVQDVRLNGSTVQTTTSEGIHCIRLTGLSAGTMTLLITYTLPQTVYVDNLGYPALDLPLLSGFIYPVEQMTFSVTLPGLFSEVPTFTSGYHQSSIESHIQYSIAGNTISGNVTTTLKDHETLRMNLRLPAEMFPPRQIRQTNAGICLTMLLLCGAVALVYYLAAMGSAPLLGSSTRTAPESVSAGELGTLLVGKKCELSLMVLTWAQLGYLQIRMDLRGRVTLVRQMEMGNERSSFENRCFTMLFGKRSQVDAGTPRYAKVCLGVAAATPKYHKLFSTKAPVPQILMALSSLAGSFAGAAIGDTFSQNDSVRMVWMVLLAVVAAGLCLQIQLGCRCFHLRDKFDLYLGLGAAGILVLGGLLTGTVYIALPAVVLQFFFGLAGAYGRRRTTPGRQMASNILGLRRYLGHIPAKQLQRIARQNPDYYYAMIPYAMALGVGRKFSHSMGSVSLPHCNWLSLREEPCANAAEFCLLLEDVLYSMDIARRRFPWERNK